MKLSLQSLKNVMHTVEVDPEKDTFDELRRLTCEAFGYPPDSKIVIIHQTKIIQKTDAKISTVPAIKDGDRLVIMRKHGSTQTETGSAASANPAPGATVTAPVSANAANIPPAASPAAGANSAPTATSPQAAGEQPAAASTPTSGILVGSAADEMINSIVQMGFDRASVVSAMRAAFNNPDRAIEYLTNGIPEHAQAEVAQPATTAPSAADTPATEAEDATQGEFLQRLRAAAQSNPQMLGSMLEAIGQQNPELMEAIARNPEQFLNMIMAGGQAEEDAGNAGHPGQTVVQLTNEEHDAVVRLTELGFNREDVLRAFLACDRNENLTANFLFDNPDFGAGQQ